MLNPRKYKDFNIIIAEFMNLQKEGEKWIHPFNSSKIVNLKYQESWDWIMPVAEKIYNLGNPNFTVDINIMNRLLTIFKDEEIIMYEKDEAEPNLLLSTYALCYKFLKWYKNNNF